MLALLAVGGTALTQRPVVQSVAPNCSDSDQAAAADGVARAFEAHPFVFLGSTHGSKKRQEFLLCLLSRPTLRERVTDVLVEWANPVHQQLLDRYLIEQDDITTDSLKKVWFDTDGPELWGGMPQIPSFFVRLRALNANLEKAERIRILGGAAPVDWSKVASPEDMAIYPFKTNWAAHVVTEHFASSDRPLLVVYGEGHIHHNGGTLMSDVEARLGRESLYVVGTVVDLGEGEVGHVGRLGDPGKPFFVEAEQLPPKGPYPGDFFYVRDQALQAYVDAVVYLGPASDHDLSGTVMLTDEQRAELAQREELKGDGLRSMELRFLHREAWFSTHPEDLPERR